MSGREGRSKFKHDPTILEKKKKGAEKLQVRRSTRQTRKAPHYLEGDGSSSDTESEEHVIPPKKSR